MSTNGASPDDRGVPSPKRVAVVTGASAGLGRSIAIELAENGFDVALLARGRAGLDGAAADVRATGRTALAIPTDVADHDQVSAAAERVERELGEIDLWVNNTMTTAFSPSWEMAPADFKRAVEVTFLGQVWGTLVALEHMRPRDRGNIVNIGSALAFLAIPLQSAYCSAKYASRGFFESVRAELLHERSNIRMSIVHMPALNTPQFGWCQTTFDRHPQPVPPIYEPEQAARYVVQAALDGRRSKIVGSWNKLLVAAGALAPGFANQYAALGAWEAQLTDRPVSPDRPANLWAAVDEDDDVGMHGIFADRAGGFFDSSFVSSLPGTAMTAMQATGRLAREKVGWLARTDHRQRARLAAAAGAVGGLLAVLRLTNAD